MFRLAAYLTGSLASSPNFSHDFTKTHYMVPCIIMSSENNTLQLIHLSSPSRINSIEPMLLSLALWRRKTSKTCQNAASNSLGARQASTLRRCVSLAWSASLSPSSLTVTVLNPSLWGSNKVSHLLFRYRPGAHKKMSIFMYYRKSSIWILGCPLVNLN